MEKGGIMKKRIKDVLNFIDNTGKDLIHLTKIGTAMGVIPCEVPNAMAFVGAMASTASLTAHAIDVIEQKGEQV